MASLIIETVDDKALTFFGPLESETAGRKKLRYSDNVAAAYVPSRLLNTPTDWRGRVEELIVYPEISMALLADLKEDIKNHFENRLQIFLQQMLLLYKSGFTNTGYGADEQVGSTGRGHIDYAGCHSSTVPRLISTKENQAIAFAKHSTVYHTWNLTVLLPKVVNAIDSRLDGHNRELGVTYALRKRATNLLNAISVPERTRDLKDAFIAFTVDCVELLDKGIAKCVPASERPQHVERMGQEKYILNCYKEVAVSYRDQLQRNDELVKQLCFAATADRVNDLFYLTLQREMYQHLGFQSETQPLIQRIVTETATPMPRPLSPKQQTQALKPSQGKVRESLAGLPSLRDQAKKYKTLCETHIELLSLIQEYLATTADSVIINDMSALPNIKTSQTLGRYPLSLEIRKVHAAAINVIRNSTEVKEPRDMGNILCSLLQTASQK